MTQKSTLMHGRDHEYGGSDPSPVAWIDVETPVGPTGVFNSGPNNGPTIAADTDYLCEVHYYADGDGLGATIDCYVDGTLFSSFHRTNAGAGAHVGSGCAGVTIGWGNLYVFGGGLAHSICYWGNDFRWGTSRGGSDLFANSLAALPTTPPWTSVTYAGTNVQAETVAGTPRLRFEGFTNPGFNTTEIFYWAGSGVTYADCWITETLRFSSDWTIQPIGSNGDEIPMLIAPRTDVSPDSFFVIGQLNALHA